jgi:hypothetical protein
MIENGKFTLWYGGCSSGCGTEQVGRANGRFINGTISNIIDFGTRRPVSFDRITLNATVPGTSQVTLAVRSSANGLAWSGFETIPANGTITTTASNRYFEWRVSLNASLGSAPPVYRAVMLNYSTYAAQGRYESSDIIFGDLVTDPRLSVATTLPGPSVVSRQISTDRGATWTNAPNGVAVPLGPPAGELRYGLTLSGSTFQTPVIDAVTLDVNTTGLPADVTAKFGPTGNLIFSSSGPLSTTPAEVQLPLSQLNFIVSNAHLLDPSATSVDIPLHLSSTHFGTVEISGLVVNLTRPNPITATFFPSGPVTLAENQTAQFTTDAVSPYAPMFITWMVDGAEKTGARNMASFNFTPSFDMAGAHTVVCLVENDDTTVSNSWAVTVTEVNRPPTIRSITPTSPESFSHTASISLAVNATDLDGQPVTYAWQLDNTPLPAATAELILSALALGSHSAMVTVSDGLASSTASWTFEITDAAPVATLSPVGDQSMSHTGSLALSVTASDADGDTVTFAWRVDGVAVTATGSTFTLSRPATGVHTVEVRATGGSRSVTLFWNVTATNAAPQQVSRDPTAPSTVAFGSTMFFNISVSDADGDAVTAVWSVDGTIMAGSATQFQLPTDLTPGQHEVKYTGTDPDGAKVEALWGVTVGAAPAPPSTPAPGAWAAVAVLAAVAAIAGARRKRP